MNRKSAYLLAFAVFLALVAAARWDLIEQAAATTMRQFAKGGATRTKLLFEIALFAGILGLTAKAVSSRTNPRRDALFIILGSIAGWCAEAWGTRLFLWRYYTAEAPPLWIVPAWPLGILVIDHIAQRASNALKDLIPPNGYAAIYWLLVAGSAFIFHYFSQPVFFRSATLLLAGALLAGFLVKPEPRKAVPFILTGFVCVFFADLWGTTNQCWRYYIQHPHIPGGLWIGVSFGMTFDTALVFLCWRLGNFIDGRLPGALGQRA